MELERLLSTDPVSTNTIHALRTAFVPLQMFDSDVAAHGLLTREQEYDAKHTFPPKNAFNHLIESLTDDIEVILAENDVALRDQLVEGFAKETAEDLADINFHLKSNFLDDLSIILCSYNCIRTPSRLYKTLYFLCFKKLLEVISVRL